MNLEETRKFLSHWLLLLGAACVWFAWDSRYVRNIWFMAMVGVGVVFGEWVGSMSVSLRSRRL